MIKESSLEQDDEDTIMRELRDKADEFTIPKYRRLIIQQEQTIRDKKELSELLQESLIKRAQKTRDK
jgi:hypothetical protein